MSTGATPLARRAVDGLAYLLLGQGGQVVLQLITFPILARLVAPEAFGLVAATFVIVNVGMLISTAGLTTALIQLREMTTGHLRVAFTLQLAMASIVFGTIVLLAGDIAAWLRMPDLPPVLQLMALAYFVRTLTVGDVILSRELRFRPLAVADVTAYALGYGLVTVGLAAAGLGVWALVLGHLAAAVTHTTLLWIFAPHPALPLFDRGAARDLLGTGFGITLSHAGFIAANEADNLIVGRWLGAHALGLYERAYRLMQLPATVLGHVLHEVLYPSMASVQEDAARLRNMFAVSTSTLAMLTLPTTVVAWLVTEELVLVVLGAEWLPMRAALDVIVLAMYLKAIESVTDSTIVATGGVYQLAKLRWAYFVAVVAGAYVGQQWGLQGVATGVVLAMAGSTTVLFHISLRRVGLGWRDLAALHAPAGLLSLAVGLSVLPTVTLARMVGMPPALILVVVFMATIGGGVALVRLAPHWRATAPIDVLASRLVSLAPGPRAQRLGVLLIGRRHATAPDRENQEVAP